MKVNEIVINEGFWSGLAQAVKRTGFLGKRAQDDAINKELAVDAEKQKDMANTLVKNRFITDLQQDLTAAIKQGIVNTGAAGGLPGSAGASAFGQMAQQLSGGTATTPATTTSSTGGTTTTSPGVTRHTASPKNPNKASVKEQSNKSRFIAESKTVSQFVKNWMMDQFRGYGAIDNDYKVAIDKHAASLEKVYTGNPKAKFPNDIAADLFDVAAMIRKAHGPVDGSKNNAALDVGGEPPAAEPAPAGSPAPAAAPARASSANAQAKYKQQQQTTQNMNQYIQKAAKTLNATPDKKQKIALTKELVNYMADRKGYPEWENALATVQQVIKKGGLDPNFTTAALGKIKAGQTIAEAWKMFYINKLLESVRLTWKDLGLTVLKESSTRRYIIRETKLMKKKMV